MFAAIGESIPEVDANAKVLLRLFVHFHGQRVILLVQGYDKGGDSSSRRQQAEIKRARKALIAWKLAEDRRIKTAVRPSKTNGAPKV